LRGIVNPAGSLVLSLGRPELSLRWNAALALAVASAAWLGAYVGGALGAALGLLAVQAAFTASSYPLLVRPALGAGALALPEEAKAPLKAVRRVVRAALRAAAPSVSAARLDAQLAKFAIPRGRIVHAQGSLSALGRVQGGADAVIEALTRAVVLEAEGTLAMPAFSIGRSMHETLLSRKVFDPETEPSTVGALSECFRRRPGTLRSVHPTHSVAAAGPDAAWLVEGHESCGSTFGVGSPYAKMLERDAWLIGLGIDIGPITFYHAFEELAPRFPLNVYTDDSPLESECFGRGGARIRVKVMAHDPAVSRTRIDRPLGAANREAITRYLETTGRLRWSPIGSSRAWIIPARGLFDALGELMERGVTIYSTPEQIRAAGLTERGA